MLVSIPVFTFLSCSDSDSDDNEPKVEDTPSIIGVWENDNYFISFGDDGFYAAYIADEFIDSGNYAQSKDAVLCRNTYFNRTTIYTIQSISDTELKVDVTYTDLHGKSQNRTRIFGKTDALPASQSNTLSGKSYTWLTSVFGNIKMTFSTDNTGIKSATIGSAAKYPLKFFYIYISEIDYFISYSMMNQFKYHLLGHGLTIMI